MGRRGDDRDETDKPMAVDGIDPGARHRGCVLRGAQEALLTRSTTSCTTILGLRQELHLYVRYPLSHLRSGASKTLFLGSMNKLVE